MEPMIQEHDRFCVRMCVRTLKNGAPGAIPTRDLPLRRRTLYATELREHAVREESIKDNYSFLRLVLDQRPNVIPSQLLSSRQELQLDHKHQPHNRPAKLLDKINHRPRSPAGR